MEYPDIGIRYLTAITDSTGIIQHSSFAIPNRNHGYTTDDNARALIAAIQEYDKSTTDELLLLITTYLSFIHHAHNPGYGFMNCMSYQRDFLDINGTDDCLGRCLWACGYASSANIPERIRITAKWLFDETFLLVDNLRSPRAKAYALMGIHHYLGKNPIKPGYLDRIVRMADSLCDGMRAFTDSNWQWYEPYFTYGNAILPMGMMASAGITGSAAYDDVARKSLDFLSEMLIIDGQLDLIGNNGWYLKGGKRAIFDQQTIDAGYTVMMFAEGFDRYGGEKYKEAAMISYEWFFGRNRSGLSVYDVETGGCFDAIIDSGVNQNQGAESIICILMAQNAVRNIIAKAAEINNLSD